MRPAACSHRLAKSCRRYQRYPRRVLILLLLVLKLFRRRPRLTGEQEQMADGGGFEPPVLPRAFEETTLPMTMDARKHR